MATRVEGRDDGRRDRPRSSSRVQPTLAGMAADLWYLGEREDLAAALKIFGNSMLFAMTGGIADILAMAKNLGVSPTDAISVFSQLQRRRRTERPRQKIAHGDFSASFELTMARKDMRLMLEAAGNEPLAVLPAIAKRMDEAIARGTERTTWVRLPPQAFRPRDRSDGANGMGRHDVACRATFAHVMLALV